MKTSPLGVCPRPVTPSDLATGAWPGPRARVGVRFRRPAIIHAARRPPRQLGGVVPAATDVGRGQKHPHSRGRLSGQAFRPAYGAGDRCVLSASVSCVHRRYRRQKPRRMGATAQCRVVEFAADTQSVRRCRA